MAKNTEPSTINSTKRGLLRSAACASLGTTAFINGSLAKRKRQNDIITDIKSSRQYNVISSVANRAGYVPRISQAAIDEIKFKKSKIDRVTIPTENDNSQRGDVIINVSLPQDSARDFIVEAIVKINNVYAGSVYTDEDIVRRPQPYVSTHQTREASLFGFSPAGFGGGLIPDDPIGGIIDAGESILDGASGAWNSTASLVQNNNYITDAVKLGGDAFDFGVNAISPIDGDKPPKGLQNWADRNGFKHLATVDIDKLCATISLLSIASASAFTVATGGAGAISFAVAGKIAGSCAVASAVESYVDDTGICAPTQAYMFGKASPSGQATIIPIPGCKR